MRNIKSRSVAPIAQPDHHFKVFIVAMICAQVQFLYGCSECQNSVMIGSLQEETRLLNRKKFSFAKREEKGLVPKKSAQYNLSTK